LLQASSLLAAGLLVSATVACEANFRVRDPGDTSVDWQMLMRAAVCGLCGLYGLMHLPRTWPMLRRFPAFWTVLLAAWASVSAPLAVNVPYAAGGCISLWCVILFVPAAVLRLGRGGTLVAALVGVLLVLGGSWFTYYFLPDLGQAPYVEANLESSGRLAGLQHPNGTAIHATVALTLLVALGTAASVRWKRLFLPLGFCVVTVLMTGSRAGMITAAIVMLVAWFRKASAAARILGAGSLATFVLLAVACDFDSGQVVSAVARSGDSDEIYSMNGRLGLWQFTLGEIAKSPVMGHGYGCSRFVTSENDEWYAAQSHNLLLEAALTTGVVGLAMLLAMLLTQARGFLTRPDSVPDLLLVLVLVQGMSEPVLFCWLPAGLLDTLWLLSLCWRDAGTSNEDCESIACASPSDNSLSTRFPTECEA
jgi:O-antigen ligase